MAHPAGRVLNSSSESSVFQDIIILPVSTGSLESSMLITVEKYFRYTPAELLIAYIKVKLKTTKFTLRNKHILVRQDIVNNEPL